MKKTMAMIMTAILTVVWITGCGSQNTASDTEEKGSGDSGGSGIEIGFTADYLNDFMSYVVAGVEQAAGDNGVNVSVQDAEFDTAKQLQQVENFIMAGKDAVVCKPVDSANCQPLVDACEKAGIPFVCVNNYSEAGSDSYVGSDPYLAGQLQAEYLNETLPDGGEIGILEGDLSYSAVSVLVDGVTENLNENINVYSMQDCGWMRDEAMETMENWISAGTELDAVIGNNDEMAIGAAKVLKENGVSGVTVCGIDASEDALEMVKSGDMTMTVFQNGYQQGYVGVETALKLINGEQVEDYVDIPYEVVTAEDVQEYKEFYESMK